MAFDYEKVDSIINRIAAVFSPKMIIIFGSVARHEAGDHSDLDILVVMDTDLKGARRAAAIYRQTQEFMMPMDVLVMTPSEYEANKDNAHSFASEIVRTGVVAYESPETRQTAPFG